MPRANIIVLFVKLGLSHFQAIQSMLMRVYLSGLCEWTVSFDRTPIWKLYYWGYTSFNIWSWGPIPNDMLNKGFVRSLSPVRVPKLWRSRYISLLFQTYSSAVGYSMMLVVGIYCLFRIIYWHPKHIFAIWTALEVVSLVKTKPWGFGLSFQQQTPTEVDNMSNLSRPGQYLQFNVSLLPLVLLLQFSDNRKKSSEIIWTDWQCSGKNSENPPIPNNKKTYVPST